LTEYLFVMRFEMRRDDVGDDTPLPLLLPPATLPRGVPLPPANGGMLTGLVPNAGPGRGVPGAVMVKAAIVVLRATSGSVREG